MEARYKWSFSSKIVFLRETCRCKGLGHVAASCPILHESLWHVTWEGTSCLRLPAGHQMQSKEGILYSGLPFIRL